MFSRISSKERIAYVGIFSLILGGAAFAAFSRGQKPAPIVFESKPEASAPAPKAQEVVVQVAGEVKKPGVYRFGPEGRVDDAVKAAGGPNPGADLDSINLAAKLIDGSQIYIRTKQAKVAVSTPSKKIPETLPGTIPPVHVEVPAAYRGGPEAPSTYAEGTQAEPLVSKQTPSTAHPASEKKSPPPPGSIDLNTATADDLIRIPGIGPATAEKILKYRTEHGRFASVEELLAVKGIGPKKLDAIRDYVRVS